jgi:hypothetical protein
LIGTTSSCSMESGGAVTAPRVVRHTPSAQAPKRATSAASALATERRSVAPPSVISRCASVPKATRPSWSSIDFPMSNAGPVPPGAALQGVATPTPFGNTNSMRTRS